MTREEAQSLLSSYRPGVDDANDARNREALAQLQSDPELAAWYENQCAVDEAIRRRLRAIPVPAELPDRIRSGLPAAHRSIPWTPARALPRLAAAAAVAFACLWGWSALRPRTFEQFSRAMIHEVSGEEHLDTHAETLDEVREDLAKSGWPADYVVPLALQTIPVEGGKTLRWRGYPVSVVCLETETEDYYWFFIVDTAALADPPGAHPPGIRFRNRFATTAWSEQRLTYFLAAEGIPDAIQAVVQAVVQQKQSE